MNLDELETKALASVEAVTAWRESDPPNKALLNASYEPIHELHSLCTPSGILHLIERARAGEELYEAMRHECETTDYEPWSRDLEEAIARWSRTEATS